MLAELRARARALRRHALGLRPGDPAADVLTKFAANLEAEARALEAKEQASELAPEAAVNKRTGQGTA